MSLLHHYIPAKRKSDNVLGLYDIIGNSFLTNLGGGTLTAGSNASDHDLPNAYQELTYIQTDSDSYFNTNYYPNNTTWIEADLEHISHSINGTIFGCKPPDADYDEYVLQFYGSSSTNCQYTCVDKSVNGSVDLTTRNKILGINEGSRICIYVNGSLNNSRNYVPTALTSSLPAYISACYRKVSASQNPDVVRKLSMKLYAMRIGEGAYVPEGNIHLYHNGNGVEHLVYNGNTVDHLYYNGNSVF